MYFFLTYLIGCGGEPQKTEQEKPKTSEEQYIQKIREGGKLLELKLTEGERLANIYNTAADIRFDDLFLIHSYEGYHLQQLNKNSIKFKKLKKVYPLIGVEEFICHVVDNDDNEVLLYVSKGEFIHSESFKSIQYGTDYGKDDNHKSWVGTRNERDQIIFFEGQFDYGPKVRRIKTVYSTPDKKTVEYRIEKQKYGVGKEIYSSQPSWLQLDEKWLFTAKKNKEVVVVINYVQKGAYKTIGTISSFGEGKRIVFKAEKLKDDYVVSISGVSSDEEFIEQGPFNNVSLYRGKIPIHDYSKAPQFIAKENEEVDGKKFSFERIFYVSTNHKWEVSSKYASIKMERDLLLDRPLARAQTDEGLIMLRGIIPGPVVQSISSLQTCFKQQKIMYTGTFDKEKQSVVINEEKGKSFTSIRSLSTTNESDTPFYIGKTQQLVEEKKVSFESVVLNTDESPPVQSVVRILERKDDIIWLSKVSEQNAVGINLSLGEKFDSINKIQLSKADVLWYQAINNEMQHMVIETNSSRPYKKLSRPKFTSLSYGILYSGRVVKEPTTDDGIPTFTDFVVRNNEDVSSFKHTPKEDSVAKKLRSNEKLPEIFTVRDSDYFYYLAKQNSDSFIGWNNEKWGGFDAITGIKVLPDVSGLAYIATKNKKQAVHVNGERHKEYDSVQSLRFTLDNLYVRYKAKLDKKIYEIVNKQEYLAVKDEKLNRNGDIFVYQGQTNAGWSQMLNYDPSETFSSLSRAMFTPDGYGVEVSAKKEKKEHFLHKFHGESFVKEKGFVKVSASRRYYLPYKQANVLFKGEEKGVYHIGFYDEQGEKTYLDVPKITEDVFLSLGRNVNRVFEAWIIEKTDGNKIYLKNGPSKKVVEKLNSSYRKSFDILPLKAPYTYSASKSKTRGVVFEENFYKSIDNEIFTNNRKLVLRTKEDGGMRVVFEGNRTGTFGAISKDYYFHPGENSEDLFAFKAYSSSKIYSSKSQLVITNNQAKIESFGYHSNVSFVQWTPLSKLNEHTIVWSGPGFVSVGMNHYDKVRKIGISPNLGHLNYVATKGGFEFVYHKTIEGDKYKSIHDYTLQGENDDATFVGEHLLSREDQIQRVDVLSQNRSIYHIVQGEKKTDWYESILYFMASDNFEAASFLAKRQGAWQIYKGKESTSPKFHDIKWFYRDSESKNHFLGRDREGWHEYHAGIKKRTVSSLLSLPDYEAPKTWVRTDDSFALMNQKGEYIYAAEKDGDEVLYHADEALQSVYDIQKFWVFEYEQADTSQERLVSLHQKKDKTQYLVVGKSKSELFDLLIQEPQILSSTGDIYTVIDKSSISKKKWKDLFEADEKISEFAKSASDKELILYLKEKKLSYPYSKVLLKNVESSIVADSISVISLKESGPICSVQDSEGKYIYHSGKVGPRYDELNRTIWGESLESSRYVYSITEEGVRSEYLGSVQKLLGPFDNATLSKRMHNDKPVFLLTGKNNHLETLYVNEKEVSIASRIDGVLNYSSVLVVQQKNLNTKLISFKDQPLESFSQLVSSNIDVDGKSYSLALRKEQDIFALQFEDKISEETDMMWDIRVRTDKENIIWTWLAGTIDYSEAVVNVFEKSLSIPKDSDAVLIKKLDEYVETAEIELPDELLQDIEKQAPVEEITGTIVPSIRENNISSINTPIQSKDTIEESTNSGSFGKKRKRGSSVRIGGNPTILGGLDKSLIDAVLKRNMSQIRYCYQRQLDKKPSLNGKIKVKFVIARDGSVSKASIASSTMGAAGKPIQSCIVGRLKKFKFPKPNGGLVIVKYPFIVGG